MGFGKQNTFRTPDFAFPQTVADNARPQLEQSLKGGDGVTALRAAIQLTIADNLVSRDKAGEGAALLDSLSKTLPAPYSALAALLEARLYRDAYSATPWVYNGRTLPATPVPADFKEWSREMFANRICRLVNEAMTAGGSSDVSIKEIAPLLTDSDEAQAAGLTAGDFIAIQSLDILRTFTSSGMSVIPFFADRLSERSGGDASSISQTIADHVSAESVGAPVTRRGAYMAYAMLSSGAYDSDTREKQIDRCIEHFKSSDWCAPFLILKSDLVSREKERKEIYAAISGYISARPGCLGKATLQSILDNMKATRITLTAPGQQLPGKEIKGTAEFSNTVGFYVLAMKVADTYLDNALKESEALLGSVAATCHVTTEGTVPFTVKKEFTLSGLDPGVYALIPSSTADKSGAIRSAYKNATVSTMLVSRITAFTANSAGNSAKVLYVVDGSDQKPVAGARVTFTPSYRQKGVTDKTVTTDRNGAVEIPSGSFYVTVKDGKDIFRTNTWGGRSGDKEEKTMRGQVLTDLSVYRPGDTVRFSIIGYTAEGKSLNAAAGHKFNVLLMDANWQNRDTLELTTDRYGRADGQFALPTDGLLGRWGIRMLDGDSYCGDAGFQIAEYKSPTFYVTAEGTEGECRIGDPVRIKGQVKTYAGMPVAGAAVKFDVSYQPVWWMPASGNATYGGTATSDGDGNFLIELPTENLRGTRYALGRYRLAISATDAAGETQQAQPVSFSLGEAYTLQPAIPEYLNVTGKYDNGSVAVYDMLGKPVSKPVYYRIIDTASKTMATGEFESPEFKFDLGTLASGTYRLEFALTPDFKSESPEEEGEDADAQDVVERQIVIWRESDRQPAEITPLWLPESEKTVKSGVTEVAIRVGSSYPGSSIVMTVADSRRVIERRWVEVTDGFATVKVKAPSGMERVKVTFGGMHDLEYKKASVTLIPEDQKQQLEISTETFRDRIAPGSHEEWKYRFRLGDRDLADLPVIAVMSNKALNALVPFAWNFNPFGQLYWNIGGGLSYDYIGSRSWNVRPTKTAAAGQLTFLTIPQWDTYGYNLYGGGNLLTGAIRVRGSRQKVFASVQPTSVSITEESDGAIMADSVVNEMKAAKYESAAEMDHAVPDAADAGFGMQPEVDETPLREVECPIAFFMPSLTTDSMGIATVSFDVPDFNGTWQMQILGYTPDMRGAVSIADAIAAKAVMVSTNAPRFMRTGDTVSVSATAYNNTADAAPLSAKIVIFDPISGKTLLEREYDAEEVAAMGSRTVTAEWTVPGDLTAVGVKAYGIGSRHTDGEQAIVPVYPSSTPVTESTTFYLSPGEETFGMELPASKKNGVKTLTYTDNPVWECLLALPDLSTPDSRNVLAQADALYANATAAGLLRENPRLLEALKVFADPANASDSTLVSNLEKNASLKTVLLNNTPWVRDAQGETLRMQRLTEYSDSSKSFAAITANIKALRDRQNEDGGWSWCEGMESSSFITSRVVLSLSMLERMGYLPEEGRAMALKGIGYCDRDYVMTLQRTGEKNFNYFSMLDYLYVRSYFDKVSTSSGFAAMKRKAIAAVKNEWKKSGIYAKATAATLLQREGDRATARQILESLRQYASTDKEKGMWFDNLDSGYMGRGRLVTTAQVLEAYSQIVPDAKEVDLLRQWLLLSRQTQNWGESGVMAEVVQAILTSGSEWTGDAEPARITIGGKEIVPDKVARLTGSLTVSLADVSGRIEIERHGAGPAWGGVIEQYVAPIRDVRAAKTGQLSITKDLYIVTADSKGGKATSGAIRTGDKVRVTLTIKCDRDLQYVAVTDSRAACLEPAEQISGYTDSDGVWMYKEVRTSGTNLFIPFLSKGTHVISYDCYVDREGEYSCGIATAQSQYAPVITAHSAGAVIEIR